MNGTTSSPDLDLQVEGRPASFHLSVKTGSYRCRGKFPGQLAPGGPHPPGFYEPAAPDINGLGLRAPGTFTHTGESINLNTHICPAGRCSADAPALQASPWRRHVKLSLRLDSPEKNKLAF